MNVLITGGLGNLGLWLTKYFLGQGDSVTVLGRSERVTIEHDSYKFIEADITDKPILLNKIDQYYDVCIHAASFNEHFKSDYNIKSLLINSLGTDNLCEALLINGVGSFLYLSTFHVYGATEGLVTEDTPINPSNDYGLTHFFAEKYIEKHHKLSKLNYSIIRLTNSYGCPEDVNTDKWYLVLNELCKQAFERKKITLMGNGGNLRDFIWMGDVCKIIYKITSNSSRFNDIYNLSSSLTYSIKNIALVVQREYLLKYGQHVEIEHNTEDKNIYPLILVSNHKLKSVLNFEINDKIATEIQKIFSLLER